MTDRPQIKPGEWIKVAKQNCRVIEAENEDSDGQCRVVFESGGSSQGKAIWNGEEWVPETSGSGYAEKQPHPGKLRADKSR